MPWSRDNEEKKTNSELSKSIKKVLVEYFIFLFFFVLRSPIFGDAQSVYLRLLDLLLTAKELLAHTLHCLCLHEYVAAREWAKQKTH